MSGRPRIYVSGPLTTGDLDANVELAKRASIALFTMGLAFECPHLEHREMQDSGLTYEQFMANDLARLDGCEALLRLPGESLGADREVEFAEQHEPPIPVYRNLYSLQADFAPGRGAVRQRGRR